jgi:hypothetical protein
MAANVASIVFLSRFKPGLAVASCLKLGARYVVVVLGCLLAIEALFPICLPSQYAETLNLSRGFPLSIVEHQSFYDRTFVNDRQATSPSTAAFVPAAAVAASSGQHEPAAGFESYEHDANRGLHYVNAFHGNMRAHDYLKQDVLKQGYEILYSSGETTHAAQLSTPLFRRCTSHGYFALAFALHRLGLAGAGMSFEPSRWSDSHILDGGAASHTDSRSDDE